jgi:hypothetical protein
LGRQSLFPDATPADPDDNPFVTYHYEDSALTGITDEHGVR